MERNDVTSSQPPDQRDRAQLPAVSLPKGGGAIRGIGEKFATNPVTGSGSTTVPLAVSPGRSGFAPQLNLSYDSGAGNGTFGFGWSLSAASISRKTDKGLPQYQDSIESDVFILSGAEDLQPALIKSGDEWIRETPAAPVVGGVPYRVERYVPRTEGLFIRVERWTDLQSGQSHWRSISRDNVTSLYGKDSGSRIADPADPARIFSWLICESFDDKGNAIVFEYRAEDSAGIDLSQVHERNRTPESRSSDVYLKYIRYGNRISRLTQPLPTDLDWMFVVAFDYDDGHYEQLPLDPLLASDAQHRYVRVSEESGLPWSVRPDPFSSHRPGFEVRSYRRCRRALMFHHFPELGDQPCLVGSTEIEYNDLDYSLPTPVDAELAHPGSTRIASFVQSITQSFFVRDKTKPVVHINGVDYVTYLKKSLPPLEFEYTRAAIQSDIRELDADSQANLPMGLDGSVYQWVDLDGEGVSGILTEHADSLFYKPNLGEGRFGALQSVSHQPSLAALGGGDRQQFVDLAGDGQLDLAAFSGPAPGFYERTFDGDWEPFRTFGQLPNVDWRDANLRMVDLNGDGHADVLITEHQVFTCYASLAEDGFGPARKIYQPADEERGPHLVFADATQSIYLADMCGDGLTDLVRICNGEVCYWPSLGYGRFGAKVTMDNSPWFDQQDHFSHRRVRLADIDGSGVADILYLSRDGARIYFNQSGNRWSDARPLPQLPQVDDLSSATTVDLLGNGTACLVWSSWAPAEARRPLRYVDLIGGQKPHLLVGVRNNLGAETHIRYVSSTEFYLADKAAGRPWITRLPFPVHVVDRVETYDRISRNRFVSRHAYHHGYFDGEEREFRGFGMVEQWDTEELAALTTAGDFPVDNNFDEASAVPPLYTKTWFHTGVHIGRGHVSDFFAGLVNADDQGEYYREPGLTDAQARELLLEDTVLPAGLSVEEEREACRSLKGATLRQEIYALDGSTREPHPYRVAEQNFTIEMVQRRGENRYAVFFTHPREALTYHYERDPNDPRISHSLTLEVDRFGNVLKEASAGYGRRSPDLSLPAEDRARQTQTLVTYTENRFTDPVNATDEYRTPLPCEKRTYELIGATPAPGSVRFTLEEMLTCGTGAAPLEYQQNPAPGMLQKRLLEHVRTLFRRNDLTGPLPLAGLQSRALPFESYNLALTPGLVTAVYGARVHNAMLVEAGYVHSEGDANWWIPSGRTFFSPNAAHTPAQELAHASQHFFLPVRSRDPFNAETLVTYDPHDLLVLETRDPSGNLVTAGERDSAGNLTVQGNDYRVLRPRLVMDPNRNSTEVAFDAFGMVVGSAVMGKPLPAPAEGDNLSGFEADLTEAVILDHLSNPLAAPQAILGQASTRQVYDLFAYYRTQGLADPLPICSYALARETHSADLVPAGGLKIQHSFSYSDGFGREMQKKIQAEPGPVPVRDVNGDIVIGVDGRPVMTENAVSPRWVGSEWVVFNNKGKPVRQYEPFFTDTHRFEFDVRIGVSPVLFYDPIGRVVATLHPNHAWEKVVFDAWRQEHWDVNDTVLTPDPKADPHAGDFFSRLPDTDYLPTWYTQRVGGALGVAEQAAAERTAIHAITPSIAHADSLGRAFLMVAQNKFKYSDTPPAAPPVEEFYRTRTLLDIEGNQRTAIDAKDRIVMRYEYDMLSRRIHQASMEAGERWILNDVTGKPLYAWDSFNREIHSIYDAARRPVESRLRLGAGVPIVIGRTVYGEGLPNPEDHNLRTRIVQVFDQAGVLTTDEFDFKGNLLRGQRELAQTYNAMLDWSGPVPMVAGAFISRTRFDALNRPTELTAPDNSLIRHVYNEANLLNQLDANLRGELVAGLPKWTPFIENIDYDAKGQRTRVDFGNGVTTRYSYDPLTLRLARLDTRRDAVLFPGDCPQPPLPAWPGCQVQDLRYTYDPAGNITNIRDDAQQTRYFNNRRVEPSASYTYDALYRLIEATGREHLGLAGVPPTPHSYNDVPRIAVLLSSSDGNAVGRYIERYVYDEVGNFEEMSHRGTDPANPGWTRTYDYDEISFLELAKRSNRLTSTSVGALTETYSVAGNGYNAHGSLLRMPHLQAMEWDFKDQLQMTGRQAVNAGDADGLAHQGERTWYVYDSGGQRVRKVTELATGAIREERTYLGDFEIYRRHGMNALVRETLHILDDKQRVALIETQTDTSAPEPLIRYQFGNHLGSASLELDDQAAIISYEEYTPYGSTSYQAVRNVTEAAKRYRYTGEERDDENGFNYQRARYYAPWLGRWVNADPKGLVDGTNVFAYARGNPLKYTDPSGTQCDPTIATCPELMGNWSYSEPVPNRASVGHNVQRDHPIQVSLRKEQRGGAYNRSVSAARDEQTVLVETGRGYFHTEVGRLQAEINARVRAGLITSESELIEATREAYRLAGQAAGVTVNPQALDRAIVSNLATLSETAEQTAAELRALGVTPADFPSDASFDQGFSDPCAPEPIASEAPPVASEAPPTAGEPPPARPAASEPPPARPTAAEPPPTRPTAPEPPPAAVPEPPPVAGATVETVATEVRGLRRLLPALRATPRILGRAVAIYTVADLSYRFVTRGPKGVSEAVEETIALPFVLVIEGGQGLGEEIGQQMQRGMGWMIRSSWGQ